MLETAQLRAHDGPRLRARAIQGAIGTQKYVSGKKMSIGAHQRNCARAKAHF